MYILWRVLNSLVWDYFLTGFNLSHPFCPLKPAIKSSSTFSTLSRFLFKTIIDKKIFFNVSFSFGFFISVVERTSAEHLETDPQPQGASVLHFEKYRTRLNATLTSYDLWCTPCHYGHFRRNSGYLVDLIRHIKFSLEN